MGATVSRFPCYDSKPLDRDDNDAQYLSSTETEDDDDEDVEYIPPPNAYKKGHRSSVSADGMCFSTEAYIPPEYEKSVAAVERIKRQLLGLFLFNTLGMAELDIVVAAMKIVEIKAGEQVIKQGDEGDCMYVIDSGVLDCYKTVQGEEKLVATLGADDAFGELALLYNCPRAASVQCREAASLCQLDRMTFSQIVVRGTMKKRERHDNLLKSVSVLKNLSSYEVSRLADAMQIQTYTRGDYIICEGDEGNDFYIIEDGKVLATKSQADGSIIKVNEFGPSDYFGELALLKNAPRAANIIAESEEVTAFSVDRSTFTRLLGPLSDVLIRGYDSAI